VLNLAVLANALGYDGNDMPVRADCETAAINSPRGGIVDTLCQSQLIKLSDLD